MEEDTKPQFSLRNWTGNFSVQSDYFCPVSHSENRTSHLKMTFLPNHRPEPFLQKWAGITHIPRGSNWVHREKAPQKGCCSTQLHSRAWSQAAPLCATSLPWDSFLLEDLVTRSFDCWDRVPHNRSFPCRLSRGSLCSSPFSSTLKRGCFAATMQQCMHLLLPGFSNVPQAVIPSCPRHHRAHSSQPLICSPASSETLSDRAGLSAPAVTAPARAGSQLSAGLGCVWTAGSAAPRKWKGQSCQQQRHWSWDLV